MFRRAAILVLVLAAAGRASAMTSEGTLITNMATASYWSPDGVKYSVTFGTSGYVLVSNPAIMLYKTAAPTMQCSGGTVTFCIYAVNSSTISSSFNVIVEDWLPLDSTWQNGMEFLIGSRTSWQSAGNGATITPGFQWYAVGPGWRSWYLGTDPDGDPDSLGQYYIKWFINLIGPGKSVMVCYRATVL